MDQNQLYDTLEFCLQALEQGKEIDSALTEYPGLAKTLRPLLETSILARAHAVLTVPDQAFLRGQIKLSKQLEKIQIIKISQTFKRLLRTACQNRNL